MIWLIEYFGTITGRLVLGAGIVASLVALRAWDVSHQRGVGRQQVVATSKKEGAKANAKSAQVRSDAAKPGAARRLLSDPAVCRDC